MGVFMKQLTVKMRGLVLFCCLLLTAAAHGEDEQKPAEKPAGGGGGPPPALVRLGAVEQPTLQARWDVIGRLRELRQAVVAAEQSGRVVAMQAEEGDRMVANQTVLAQIDDVWAKLRLQRAQADLASAQASVQEVKAGLEQNRRDAEYLTQLREQGSAPRKEYEDALAKVKEYEARLSSSEAQVLAAQAELAQIKEELDRLAVRAPFDGVVVRKLTEVGQWLNSGAAVAEVISTGAIDVVVDVPEQFINLIKLDQEIEVYIEAIKQDVVGKVAAVVPRTSGMARTFPVKIRLANADGQLKAGMSAVAHIPTDEAKPTLTVPRDAVLRDVNGARIWVSLNGVGMPVDVRLLFGVNGRYAVEQRPGGAPLAPGMPVVIEGAERLFPGQPLQPIGPATATDAPNP